MFRIFRRIKAGSRVRATCDIDYHWSDFPRPHGMFDRVKKGDETTILKVCGKIDGERRYIVAWPSRIPNGQHLVRLSQIELVS